MKNLTLLLLLFVFQIFLFNACKTKDENNPSLNIASFTPSSGVEGGTVKISGSGFSTNPTENIVKFGTVNATVTMATATELTVTVPAGLPFGNVQITVVRNGTSKAAPGNFLAGLEEITGEITSDRRLTKDKRYLLKGNVFVTNGATLTIDPGTIIKGDKASNATLIIGRGAKINAVGTPSEPIVFTSNQAKGSRTYGDWGGVIILGKSVNNQSENQPIEGLSSNPKFQYGGNTDDDNSGILRYVRIEFCGIAISAGNEINGLTLGSVGSGTTIEYVQVSYSGDDSFEWFGGSVNCKYLIAFRGFDDDFDTDFGYRGKVQFGLGLRDPFVADQSQSNGFESDNSATAIGEPNTSSIFSNITYVGPSRVVRNTGADGVDNPLFGRGAHLRRNTSQSIFNSVIVGSNLAGISLDGTETQVKFGNSVQLKGNLIAGTLPLSLPSRGGDFSWEFQDPNTKLITFTTPSEDNSTLFNTYNSVISVEELKMSGLLSNAKISNPDLLPGSGSLVLSGAIFTDKASDSFFQKVNFKGAFGDTNWAAGWTNFDPQNTDY